MEDRDWYRAEARARQRRAEASAQAGWRRSEGRGFRPRPGRNALLVQRLARYGMMLTIGVLTALVLADDPDILGAATSGVQWPRWLDRWQAGEVPFPENGTVAAAPVPSADAAPLTIRTDPGDPGRRFVVTVRAWVSGALVACIYLKANTQVTVPLGSGQYRIGVASGQRWQGHAALFGPATRVERGTRPVRLLRSPGRTVGFTLDLVPAGHPGFPAEGVPRAGFMAP